MNHADLNLTVKPDDANSKRQILSQHTAVARRVRIRAPPTVRKGKLSNY